MKIVQSKIRVAVKGMRVSPDFFVGLDAKVDALLTSAVARAKANKRKTLRDYDL
jgi:hypothetical protein